MVVLYAVRQSIPTQNSLEQPEKDGQTTVIHAETHFVSVPIFPDLNSSSRTAKAGGKAALGVVLI
eukprot:COSAG02_NODE_4534_length_5245_cov_13.164594_7_plen_64_part_01